MLFNFIFVILVLYIISTPYFYFKAMKFGMKIADKPEEAAEMPFFNVPEKKDKPKMTPMQDRETQILNNIDRYDGTSNGQVKVKVDR